ncbi:adipolin-like [Oratosquilla oratoria]|uniref:adipolin-like n=1 Tax=Oratosquilla oratoria TaxID=337810 RepID=UPI003F766C6D
MVPHRNLASIVSLLLAVALETQEALGGVVSSSNLISRAHSNLGIASTSLHDLKNVWRKESENDEQNSFIFDPKTTWAALNRNTERQKKQRRRRRRRNRRKNELLIPKVGPPGPTGPRGPRGPPGAPGGTLSTDEMEMYIKSFVKELLDSRNASDISSSAIMEDDYVRGQGRVRVAFTAQLPHPFSLPPKEITIVDAFTILFGPGQFERGVVLEDGGFAVTKAGLYHVSASLVLQPKGKSNTLQAKPYEQVLAHICVDNCNTDRRLSWLGTLHGDGGTTAHLTGHVLLQRGQKLLVVVDNNAKRKLRVDEGSTFSAALLGT